MFLFSEASRPLPEATQPSTQWVLGDILQPHNQALNMVGAVASIVGAYMNICLYMYILLPYTYYVYTLSMRKCKRCFFQDHTIKTLICSITFHKISSICILLSKWAVSNHGGTTGNTCILQSVAYFLAGWSACLWYFANSLWVHPLARGLVLYLDTYISFRRSTNSVIQQSDMKLVRKYKTWHSTINNVKFSLQNQYCA